MKATGKKLNKILRDMAFDTRTEFLNRKRINDNGCIDRTMVLVRQMVIKSLGEEEELTEADYDFEEYPTVNGREKIGYNRRGAEIKKRWGVKETK